MHYVTIRGCRYTTCGFGRKINTKSIRINTLYTLYSVLVCEGGKKDQVFTILIRHVLFFQLLFVL